MDSKGDSMVKLPVCIIVLGMAGSGKTTFVQKFVSHLTSVNKSVYTVNLDPAVHHLNYEANIDIRDTVKFKEVMKQYGFGPNGAIMTSLNFFASQFNKVVELISKASANIDYVVFDTPGQIEVFTWSASGTIITELLGSSFPTVVAYVMDTPRSHNPVTFMSNMLYACSVLYRMRLPFIVLLNKIDIIDCQFAIDWMRDFELFQDALSGHHSGGDLPEGNSDTGFSEAHSGTSPYMNNLMNSMCLVLDEFYSNLRCCGVSSVTGERMDKLLETVEEAKKEYFETYLPAIRSRRAKQQTEAKNKKSKHESVERDDTATATTSAFKNVDGGHHCRGRLLLDVAGDDDDATEDPMIDLDGVEQVPGEDNDSSEEENTDTVDQRFRTQCSISARMESSQEPS